MEEAAVDPIPRFYKTEDGVIADGVENPKTMQLVQKSFQENMTSHTKESNVMQKKRVDNMLINILYIQGRIWNKL